jgi:hemerythrin-like metal-binding protein
LRPFGWSRAYTVSVPDVDAEHQLLFRLGSGLRRAMLAEEAPETVQAAFREFVVHVAEHFLHEERAMRSAHYSLYGWHKRQHAAGHAKIRNLERGLSHGDPGVPELLDDLARWIANHIRLADRMWAAYARNRQRELHAS